MIEPGDKISKRATAGVSSTSGRAPKITEGRVSRSRVYPDGILEAVDKVLPPEIVKAIYAQGWNTLGIYEFVAAELRNLKYHSREVKDLVEAAGEVIKDASGQRGYPHVRSNLVDDLETAVKAFG